MRKICNYPNGLIDDCVIFYKLQMIPDTVIR